MERKWPSRWWSTPGPGPQKAWRNAVDTNILRQRSYPEKVPAREETPHGCYSGSVFLGFEGEDENGEHVEVIERVPCRRCRTDAERF